MPNFDLDKIKFATDESTFKRAIELYESGKIQDFKDTGYSFTAKVKGGSLYSVFISKDNYDQGDCDCYLGQNDTLCKHMVAVAIYAVLGGKPLNENDKRVDYAPKCSGEKGDYSNEELNTINESMRLAERLIKSYRGPSKYWLSYQDSLSEGCNRLSTIISGLLVSEETATLIIKLLLRLDRKLRIGGVDDSDGTVGGFIEESVLVLEEFVKLDPSCIESLNLLQGKETSFGWEEPLLRYLKN